MAKLTFTKLGLKTNSDVETLEFNEQIIEVKQYLPVNDKLTLISEVINNSADENNFANPVKVEVYTTIAIVETYTNITFTDKQKEDVIEKCINQTRIIYLISFLNDYRSNRDRRDEISYPDFLFCKIKNRKWRERSKMNG